MLCSVMDVGSNSIRMSIYQCEGKTFQILMNHRTVAGLASYISDGLLSSAGIRKACQVIEDDLKILDGFQISDRSILATASLRNNRNSQEAVKEIENRVHHKIRVLSGEEEAYFSYLGMNHHLGADNGIMADIGGASTELLYFDGGKVVYKESLPIGSLSLYSRYVKAIFPIDVEKKAMKRAIDEQLSKIQWTTRFRTHHLYGVGGTFRAVLKLSNTIFPSQTSGQTLDVEVARLLLKNYQHINKKMCHELLQLLPERIHTILPGLMILEAVARKFKCTDITVSQYGVREGFLLSKISETGEPS